MLQLLPGPALVHEGLIRGSVDRPVRSGAPPARLNRLSPHRSRLRTAGSQDSLASTGSNQDLMQELQRERETVVELVEDVMRRSSPEAAETVLELAGRPAGSREAIGRKHSMDEIQIRRSHGGSEDTSTNSSGGVGTGTHGARHRSVQTPVATPRTVKPGVADKDQEGNSVLLKQTSWASRRAGGGGAAASSSREGTEEVAPPTGFTRNRDLWERRTNSTPSSDEEKEKERGGFRGSRSFWEQRAGSTRQQHNNSGQTPDLVMDLPAGALASSPPVPIPRPRRSRSPSSDSIGSSGESSASGESNMSPSLSSADTFAAADTDTLKKSAGSVAVVVNFVPPPTPKPRPEPLVLADLPRSQVVPIRSPGPRTPRLTAKFGGSVSTSPTSTPTTSFPGAAASPAVKSPFLPSQLPLTSTPTGGNNGSGMTAATPTSSFKPAVRVKPLLQVKPSEVRKEPPPKDFK